MANNPTAASNRIHWKIRPATIDDKGATRQVLAKSYSTILPNDYEEDVLKICLPIISNPRESLLTSGTWYVAEHPQTGQIVGCGGWTKSSPMSSKKADDNSADAAAESMPHMRHFATDPEFTRKGVAKAIWNQIWSDICAELGEDTRMEVYSTLSAEAFYSSLGFNPIKQMSIPLGPEKCPFPCILMVRPSSTA